MRVMVHTGGASIPGSGIVGADFVVRVQPDVAGHVNGGPTALPLDHVERILDETSARVEIVHNGNVKAAGEVAALVARRGELAPAGDRHRQPRGIGRPAARHAAGGVVGRLAGRGRRGDRRSRPPPGTSPPLHGLNIGVVAVGREADLLVMDAPLGSQADDALGALAIGDTPGRGVGDHRRHAALHEEPQHAAADTARVVRWLRRTRRPRRLSDRDGWVLGSAPA